MRSILILTEEATAASNIESSLNSEYRITFASGLDSALEILRKQRHDFICIDIKMLPVAPEERRYTEVFQPLKELSPMIEIIIMAHRDEIRKAVAAIKDGASDYINYPIDPVELKHIVDSLYKQIIQQSELNYLRDQFWDDSDLEIVQTQNEKMKLVLNKIKAVATTKSTVLLLGETGSGKNLMAQFIHQHSNRRSARFISVHCGAIPDTLIESELFGHEKGAFTGAIKKRIGKFEIAKGGTIFLDEIGTITPMVQIKLLQVLQDGTFSRVGGDLPFQTDARVLAASNSDLKKMCDTGQFRKDLYYRLNVFPIEIPPLRERMEDLPFLVEVILKKLNQTFVKNIYKVHPRVINVLKTYDWPGNIRELENLLERAYLLETSSILTPENFPNELFENVPSENPLPVDTFSGLTEARKKAIEDFEKRYLAGILSRNKGKIKASAEEAQISTRQLYKLMSKYGFDKKNYRS